MKDTDTPTDREVFDLVGNAQGWARAYQELRSHPSIQVLPNGDFAEWFPSNLLAAVRWFTGFPQILDPPFMDRAPWITRKGFTLTKADGLTLDHLILIPDRNVGAKCFLSVLIHELVHVVQYRHLGIDAFMDQYVRQLSAEALKDSPNWRALPLERIAYEIGSEHENGTLPPGNVTTRVLAAL